MDSGIDLVYGILDVFSGKRASLKEPEPETGFGVDEAGRKYVYNSFEECRVYEAAEFVKGQEPFRSVLRHGFPVHFFHVPESSYPLVMQVQNRGAVSFYHGPENRLEDHIPGFCVRTGEPIPYLPHIKISDDYFSGSKS
jgi:hypothetical protein